MRMRPYLLILLALLVVVTGTILFLRGDPEGSAFEEHARRLDRSDGLLDEKWMGNELC